MTGRAAALPALVLAAGLSMGLGVALGPEAAFAASKADIQWAQTVLKERGFDPGPARGELNDRTRSALSAFQKKSGIPVTGRLDDATVQRLMQGRETSSTMGNLAAPRSSGSGASSTSAARGGGEPAKPKAAPTTAVQSSGPAVDNILESVRRPSGASSGPTASGEPSPSAAPRAAIASDGGAGPGAEVSGFGTSGAGAETGGFDLSRMMAPAWVRNLVWVLVAAVALAGGLVWWLSGRRARPGKGRSGRERGMAPRMERREPTLGPTSRGPELRADRF